MAVMKGKSDGKVYGLKSAVRRDVKWTERTRAAPSSPR